MNLDFTLSQPSSQEEFNYDVLIIGGGPAGATAAIYTSRAGLKTGVIDRGLTVGALGITSKISNYPGVAGEVSGEQLLKIMRDQAASFGATFITDKVVGVDLTGEEKTVMGNGGTYTARAVILATGSMGRGTRVKGEDELLGHGVSYCATCDGAFFRNKEVAVAGNHDEAIEEALYLTRFVDRVHFLCPTPALKAQQSLVDEIQENPKVKLYAGAALKEVLGSERVEGVRFGLRGADEQTIPVSGAFIYLQGAKPETEFLMGQLETEQGYLSVNKEYQTSIEGVYAVGDLLKDHVKQAVVAAADGAVAGMAVEKFLRKRKSLQVDWSK
ncbi:MAG: FAD-dependent oxidoreductase [Anaerolineaceae bacterium]